MTLPEQFETKVEGIRKDRTSGAAKLALRAAALLIECAQSGPEQVGEAAKALASAQPAMGPIINLTRRALAASDVEAACSQFLESMEHSAARVTEIAADLIEDGSTVMTHSFSSTVLVACREARAKGKNFSVICPESRPVCEGVALAASLGSNGVNATVIVDSAIYRCLSGVQSVWVGADAVSLRGVFNKTGTSLLALAAREMGVPLYVLCSTEKFLPASYEPPPETPKDPSEVLERQLPHVSAINFYFDLTPLRFVSHIVTENGVVDPASLKDTLSAGKQ